MRNQIGDDIHKSKWKTLSCGMEKDNYRRFIQSVKIGINDSPTFADGAKIQKYLEKCELSSKLKKQVSV